MKTIRNKNIRKTIRNKNIRKTKRMKGGGDREDALARVSFDGMNLQLCQSFNNDIEIVMTAVQQNGAALQYASNELKRNKQIVLAAVSQHDLVMNLSKKQFFYIDSVRKHIAGSALKYAFPDLQQDKEVVLAAVTANGMALDYASTDLKQDKEIVLAAVTANGMALDYASTNLQQDEEVVLAAVAQDGNALTYASVDLQNNPEVVTVAVSQDGNALDYASRELQNDPEICLVAVEQNGLALEYTSRDIQNNKKVVLAAVSQDGTSLEFASEKLKEDEEIVLVAVEQNGFTAISSKFDNNIKVALTIVFQNGSALRYLSPAMKGNLEVVRMAVSKEGTALKFAAEELKHNPELVMVAVSQNGLALEYANELRDDDATVIAAISQNGNALQFANDRFKQDNAIIELAIRTSKDAYQFAKLGRPLSLVRAESYTFSDQTDQGTCGRHVFPRVIIKNIFETVYPLPVKELYTLNNCNKYLTTGENFVSTIDKLSVSECSKGGYIKILLFLHLHYAYIQRVPTVKGKPFGWLECKQVTGIYRSMYRPAIINNLNNLHIITMLKVILKDIKKRIDTFNIQLITFQIENKPSVDLFKIIEQVTREGLYLMLRIEDSIHPHNFHNAHFVLVTGTHEGKILLRNSWGSEEVYEVVWGKPIYIGINSWDIITDCTFVIPVGNIDGLSDHVQPEQINHRVDDVLERFRALKRVISQYKPSVPVEL